MSIVNPFDIDEGARSRNPTARLNMLLSMFKLEYSWTISKLSEWADVSEPTARTWSNRLVEVEYAVKHDSQYTMTRRGVAMTDEILYTWARQSTVDGMGSYVSNNSHTDVSTLDWDFEHTDLEPKWELISKPYDRRGASLDDFMSL